MKKMGLIFVFSAIIFPAAVYAAGADIQEGLGNFGGNELNEPAAPPTKFEGVYASANSSVFTFTETCLMPLIRDERIRESKHPRLIVKRDGNPAIVEGEGKKKEEVKDWDKDDKKEVKKETKADKKNAKYAARDANTTSDSTVNEQEDDVKNEINEEDAKTMGAAQKEKFKPEEEDNESATLTYNPLTELSPRNEAAFGNDQTGQDDSSEDKKKEVKNEINKDGKAAKKHKNEVNKDSKAPKKEVWK